MNENTLPTINEELVGETEGEVGTGVAVLPCEEQDVAWFPAHDIELRLS